MGRTQEPISLYAETPPQQLRKLGNVDVGPKSTVGEITVDSVQALGKMFSPSGITNYFRILSGDKSQNTDQNQRFLSPVGFGQVANDAVQAQLVDGLRRHARAAGSAA